jgi:hypothetical protein
VTTRERWIVYPLLFLALGASLRDKLIGRVETESLFAQTIECGRLELLDAQGQPRILLDVPDQSGRLQLKTQGEQAEIVIGEGDREGRYGIFVRLPGRERLVPLTLYYKPDNGPLDRPMEEKGPPPKQ